MSNNFFTKQALPLPRGRILRFARNQPYAVSATSKCPHIRGSRHTNPAASSNASFITSPATNYAAWLMLRHP